MKIRSITVFVDIRPDLDAGLLARCGAFARQAQQTFRSAGLAVQTTRLTMDIFPALEASEWADRPAEFAARLEKTCQAQGFEYVATGPATQSMLPRVAEMLRATGSVFITAQIVDPATGAIDGEMIRQSARVIGAAMHIEAGFGNLRFAALANVPAGTPFFPAAYHGDGPPSFALALESADLAVQACTGASDAENARQRLIAALETEAGRLVPVAEQLAREHGFTFGGLDFSLAPFPTLEISIGAALEALTGQPLGSAGTLAAAATLTDAIDQARFPHAGFCGLMLPVLEDLVLAQRAAQGRLNVGELLQWSAVCGTGLDTVPLPGDVSEDALVGLLFDVAALSVRLHKPLTARLMPLPGKRSGDAVHFDFAYFADGGVLPLEGGAGRLSNTGSLMLHPRPR
ncbi:MAG: DUF711 family protein [Anaerolineae bacterium]|nr:DUF711 family protein [Anaerolineae bacterium]